MNNLRTSNILLKTGKWFRFHFIQKKLETIPSILVLSLLGVLVAYSSAMIEFWVSFGFIGLFVGVLAAVACIRFPLFGFYLTVTTSLLIHLFTVFAELKNINLPFGMMLDVLNYLTLIGVLTNHNLRIQARTGFWKTPITVILLVLQFYYLIEAGNPSMLSETGWFYFFRKIAGYLFFFYTAYALFNNQKTIIRFIVYTIIFSTLLALYAVKQQWIGLAGFEMQWLQASPLRFKLFIQGGLLRKFSLLSDPATAGILFASVSMQLIVLLIRGSFKKYTKWMWVALIINLLGYSYSGTRTATLMLVAGVAFYSVCTIYERRTILFSSISFGLFAMLLVAPIHTSVLDRIRSARGGSKDPSAKVRDDNRHRVQPYLYARPLGGGIYTCIAEGPDFNKGHYLENFPPDSGYMKVFAEQGYIGLFIMLISYYVFIRYGIKYFYRSKDPEIQNQYISITAMLFTLMVGQYSQLAINQYPQVLFFYAYLAVLMRMHQFDKKKIEAEPVAA